jgi:hypothetical protein
MNSTDSVRPENGYHVSTLMNAELLPGFLLTIAEDYCRIHKSGESGYEVYSGNQVCIAGALPKNTLP